ncbi:MAG: hypothetical protein IH994_01675 [Proteobacteria bacterium]|nr:hypothetical protein [Pseudomonadota bacterium]
MASKKPRTSLALIAEMTRKLDKEIEGDCQADDLVVASGDRITLSPDSGPCQHMFKTVRPQSIDEVRLWLGSPSPISKDSCDAPCRTPELRHRLVSTDDLVSEDTATRKEALGLARMAAREYVMGNVRAVEHWRSLLDEYVILRNTRIFVAFLRDITVSNDAVLSVLASTHAVYANKIVIIGTGKISCDGPVTFNCASVEGRHLMKKTGPQSLRQMVGGGP